MLRKTIGLVLLVLLTLFSRADTDTSRLRISLLTCGPGEELYATFGHTAIRITDSLQGSDIVYNYGTFNFDDKGFYLKFVRGKLNYFLSAEYFDDFVANYRQEGRGMTEQLLQLDGAEKQRLRRALETNLLPANRFYHYDFFFDNCTTRARDMLLRYKDSVPVLKAVMPAGTKFRQAIHYYLGKNHKDWSKLSIDLLLGAPTDAVMTGSQMQFLPDNLMYALDSNNAGKTMVVTQQPLYSLPAATKTTTLFTPALVFFLLLFTIVLLGLARQKTIIRLLQGFDVLLFFATGTLGVVLVLMWVATDHAMCSKNYNLLWAWPMHFIMAFLYNSKKAWVSTYFGIFAGVQVLLLGSWFFLPQELNSALISFVVLLALRAFLRWRWLLPAGIK